MGDFGLCYFRLSVSHFVLGLGHFRCRPLKLFIVLSQLQKLVYCCRMFAIVGPISSVVMETEIWNEVE